MVLAHVFIKLKKYEEATRILRQFLDRNAKDQEAWYL
ncbi:hypothetical protein [Acidicapsa acidisoli]